MKQPSAFYPVIVMKTLLVIVATLLASLSTHAHAFPQRDGSQDGDIHFGSGTPYYDVIAFGAKGDNSTLDTAAVLNAYTTACSGGGGIVFFPANHTFKFAWPTLMNCAGWIIFKFDGVLAPTNPLVINKAMVKVQGGYQATANQAFNQWPNSFIISGKLSPVIQITSASANPVIIEGVGMDGCVGDCIEVVNGSSVVSIIGDMLRTSKTSIGYPINIDMTATAGGFGFWVEHTTVNQQAPRPAINIVAAGQTYIIDCTVLAHGIKDTIGAAGSGVSQLVLERVLSEDNSDPSFVQFDSTGGQFNDTILQNIELADPTGSGNSYLASNTGGSLKLSVLGSRGYRTAIFNKLSGVVQPTVITDYAGNQTGLSPADPFIQMGGGFLSVGFNGSVFGDTTGIVNTTLTVRPTDASKIPLMIKGVASQTGDLLDFLDGSGRILGRFDSNADIAVPKISLLTNCASRTSPAVCGSASAGSVTIAAGSASVVVNTAAVTANSQILITFDSSLGAKLGVTCNKTFNNPYVTARTPLTSFTITAGASPITNPACYSYLVVN